MNVVSHWLAHFHSALRWREIHIASPDNTDYHWSCTGSIHPGYSDRDLVLNFTDSGLGMTIALDEAAADELNTVLTAYLQWLRNQK